MIGLTDAAPYSEDDLISISSLADFAFCKRRAALHFIEGLWKENLFTAEGHLLHDKAHDDGIEVRGVLRTVRGLRLRSLRFGLIGVADVVEFHRVDMKAPPSDSHELYELACFPLPNMEGLWQIYPVEYKRGHLRHESGFEVQLCAQAICLEEMLDINIRSGAIYYGKTRRRLDISFNGELRQETQETARMVHELFDSGLTPLPEYSARCEKCTLIDSCLPKTMQKKRSVKAYIAHLLEGV